MNDRRAEIKEIIASELKVSPNLLDESMTLESLGLDSLQASEVMIAIEEKFDCQVDVSQVSSLFSRDTRLRELLDTLLSAIGEAP
jgi:acyl carrier protein